MGKEGVTKIVSFDDYMELIENNYGKHWVPQLPDFPRDLIILVPGSDHISNTFGLSWVYFLQPWKDFWTLKNFDLIKGPKRSLKLSAISTFIQIYIINLLELHLILYE